MNDKKKAIQEGDELVLDVQNLTVHYELEEETVYAINDVSLSLRKGQTIGLVGE